MFVAGKVAMVPEGAWMIDYFAAKVGFEYAWVPLPRGPEGERASMLNGLADSIWTGSRVKEQAWQWVKFMASPDCQTMVANTGIVFPSITALAELTRAVHRQKGVDSSAFLEMAGARTFPMPIADHAAQTEDLMKRALEAVLIGKQTAGPALRDANEQIRRLHQ